MKTTRNNKLKVLTVIIMVLGSLVIADVPVMAGTPYTGNVLEYYLSGTSRPMADGEYGNTSVSHEKFFHFRFESTGSSITHVEEKRIKPRFARCIRWDKPKVVSCEYCEGKVHDALYSVQIFLEDDSGSEYIRKNGYELTPEELQSTHIDFENLSSPLRVGIELTQTPGEYCNHCGRRLGEVIEVGRLIWDMTCIEFASQPQPVVASYGGDADFTVVLSKYRDIYGRDLDNYKWEMRTDGGDWSGINDGVSGTGEIFAGSDTNHLTVSNISPELSGSEFRCALTGANHTKAYSKAVSLTLPSYTQVPTLPPSVTTIPSITPAPGSSTTYTPSSSSSAYIPPQSSSTNKKPSSSSTSKPGDGGGSSYKGEIVTPEPTDIRIIPTEEIPGSSTSGKGSSSSAKSQAQRSSSAKQPQGSTSVSSRRKPGANYVMKNGVLYLVDDEDTTVGVGEESETTGDRVEESETENPYMAYDLAIDGNIYGAELETGFWDTLWGRLLIIAIGIVLLLLALYVLFFGVIVLGEVEEHDDVFELCGIRLMHRHDKAWHVNLGCAFDENAVLKLYIGLLFAVVFDEWDITGDSKGIYEGESNAPAGQGMLMFRKNVRRKV